MKQGHFVLLFLMVYTSCFLGLYLEQKKYDAVRAEKARVEAALQEAIEITGQEFSKVINASEEEKKRVVEQIFPEALYIAMEYLGSTEEKALLNMYIPMLVYVEEDGAYFYRMKEWEENGMTELSHRWTEKLEFTFSEDVPEEKKKAELAAMLEKAASEIISNHNYIASQYGISYTYVVPKFLQNTAESLSFPMLFVVFQGWPLTAAGDIVYENCIDAGMYLKRKENYTVEYPRSLSEPYCYYHLSSCQMLQGKSEWQLAENVNLQEAVQDYGAVPCNSCIP